MPRPLELRVEIIGVFPKLRAEFRLADADLERLAKFGRDHDGGQRAGIDVGMRVEAQILQRLAATRDETA